MWLDLDDKRGRDLATTYYDTVHFNYSCLPWNNIIDTNLIIENTQMTDHQIA